MCHIAVVNMMEREEEEEILQFDSVPSDDSDDPLLVNQGIEVELVDNEEFDFLDGVSELATLTCGMLEIMVDSIACTRWSA